MRTSTYLHPDLPILVAGLLSQGYDEVPQIGDDYTRMFERHGDVVMIDLPESEVYEALEVHFYPAPSTLLLEVLQFPL